MGRILLIETDRPLAACLQKYLERAGHEVEWQVDPQVAVYSADKNQPDVVVLDLLLANRSGIEFLYEFRSYPDWQQLPVVVFSNISPADLGSTINSFEQLNVSAFHYKPASSLSELTASVDRLLQPAI
jgi:DNA-binding response OmpR family regulator